MQMKPLLPPVAVNGVTIDPALIAAEAQNHPAPKGKPGAAWKAAARALAVRELLLQEARRHAIAPDPVEIEPGRWETEEEALVRQLLDEAVIPAPADEATLRARYDAEPDRFAAPALFEAAHILFAAAPDDTESRNAARVQAHEILVQLQHQPSQFADLAMRYSACSSKTAGGVLGQLSSGDTVPEFEAALNAMEEGKIALAETRYGIHVIRLDARAQGAVLPFEVVLPHLREAYEKAAWLQASRDLITELAARAQVSGTELA
ncbi:peptidylprolyl isomerase [Paracoccus rhizosphaerae]|uniref:Parvulin-like PPIase n=1 Tax=Paracoccus rhizosphaerae TaxID=1133347 RepID=A0ABV6CIP7_9RHOB|nr:peptidylprolyl isomerase [Paracoccus rhizosphaerae]